MGRSVADLPAVCLAGSGTKREISQLNPIYARIEHPDALSSYSLTLLYAYTPTLFYLLASTPVEYPLQIRPFMQNKPNFQNTQNRRKPSPHKGLRK
jgi:ABC-type sulfate transport system permease component